MHFRLIGRRREHDVIEVDVIAHGGADPVEATERVALVAPDVHIGAHVDADDVRATTKQQRHDHRFDEKPVDERRTNIREEADKYRRTCVRLKVLSLDVWRRC